MTGELQKTFGKFIIKNYLYITQQKFCILGKLMRKWFYIQKLSLMLSHSSKATYEHSIHNIKPKIKKNLFSLQTRVKLVLSNVSVSETYRWIDGGLSSTCLTPWTTDLNYTLCYSNCLSYFWLELVHLRINSNMAILFLYIDKIRSNINSLIF